MSNILQLGRAAISKLEEAYLPISGTYSEPCRICKKEAFAKISTAFNRKPFLQKLRLKCLTGL